MVVQFAICANKAGDSKILGADKQAADADNFVHFGTLLAELSLNDGPICADELEF
jgi:hypothetical protein